MKIKTNKCMKLFIFHQFCLKKMNPFEYRKSNDTAGAARNGNHFQRIRQSGRENSDSQTQWNNRPVPECFTSLKRSNWHEN